MNEDVLENIEEIKTLKARVAEIEPDAALGQMVRKIPKGLALFHNADLPLWIDNDRAEWAVVEIEHEMDVNVLRINCTPEAVLEAAQKGSKTDS